MGEEQRLLQHLVFLSPPPIGLPLFVLLRNLVPHTSATSQFVFLWVPPPKSCVPRFLLNILFGLHWDWTQYMYWTTRLCKLRASSSDSSHAWFSPLCYLWADMPMRSCNRAKTYILISLLVSHQAMSKWILFRNGIFTVPDALIQISNKYTLGKGKQGGALRSQAWYL